jgi:hypothetical protein
VYLDPCLTKHDSIKVDNGDPLSLFTSMLNAPESKRQYPKRLQVFFNFLKLEGELDA